MAEQGSAKRVIFPFGKQRDFLDRVLTEVSFKEAVRFCRVSGRTIRDWRREKFSMDAYSLHLLCKKTKIPLPTKIEFKDRYWYAIKGAKAGGFAVLKKYGTIGGDSKYRKKRWQEWWEQKGKYEKHPIIGVRKSVRKPCLSVKLAEFVGIVMGDGSITKDQVKVTLNKKDDREYVLFVRKLIESVFRVPVSLLYRRDSLAVDLVVSRRELVRFCNENLGLLIGNKIKQGLDIPTWIKEKPEFYKSCLRGLIDTDGCVFDEVHYIRGKHYSYKRLNFRSASPSLRDSVFSLFRELGMTPKMRNTSAVQLEDKEEIERYFKIVGTSNPKHLRRFNI